MRSFGTIIVQHNVLIDYIIVNKECLHYFILKCYLFIYLLVTHVYVAA